MCDKPEDLKITVVERGELTGPAKPDGLKIAAVKPGRLTVVGQTSNLIIDVVQKQGR